MSADLSNLTTIANKINAFLESFHTIEIDTYIKLIDLMPPGLSAKLRLSPDTSLVSKLAHLYEVTQLFLGFTTLGIDEDYVPVSFEGLSIDYPEDCDVVLELSDSKKLIFVDVTATRSQGIIKIKEEKLNSLCRRYEIQSRKTSWFIHKFIPYEFDCRIVIDKNYVGLESINLRLIDNLCKKSRRYTDKFLENCKRVYSNVIPSLLSTDHVSSLYEKRVPSDKVCKLAEASVTNNNLDDTINFISVLKRKEYKPYMDSLTRLSNQYYKTKSPFRYPASRVARHKDLRTALSSLNDDLLINTLDKAMSLSGRVVLMRADKTYKVEDSFPVNISNKKILASDSGFRIAAKHIKGHVFSIKFSYDEMDSNLRRILLKEPQPKTRIDIASKSSVDKLMSNIQKAENELNHMSSEMLKSNKDTTMSTIFDKMITMSDLVSKDLGNVGVVSTNMLSKAAIIIKRSLVGSLISQRYEVANSFSASIKNSSKGSNYYVGVNNPYDSVTITKMNSTQDSFKTRHYCVIGKSVNVGTTSNLVKECKKSKNGVFRSEFYTMNTNELVYELKLPYTIMSLLTWDIENNLKDGRIDEYQLPEMIVSIINHSCVNRDSFAQASQQTRYFYASSIGYGSSPSKIAEKFDFFSPKYTWEFVYLVRMIKMGACLAVLRDSDKLSSILVNDELSVAFPHSKYPVKSFNQAVSSMYFCNVFNKFRAYHEISAAICYNELDDENAIYENSIKFNRQALVGLSSETEKRLDDYDYLISEEFVTNEVEFCKKLIKAGAKRFSGSSVFMIAASNKHLLVNESTMGQIYEELNSSPIEACTMRGSMDHNASNEKGQSIRAASAMLEEMFIQRGYKPEEVNKNPNLAQQFLDELKENDSDFSIFTALIRQIKMDPVYRYRITDKDQVGHREISVLNAAFRIGALFVEVIAKTMSNQIRDVDLLEDPNKEIKYEDAVKSSMTQTQYSTVFYDNSDQKRWGPNHMLHFFTSMFFGSMPNEKGIVKLISNISKRVLTKKAKFPEPLIRYYKLKRDRGTGSEFDLTTTNSEAINSFFKKHYKDLVSEVYETEFPYGMCQGIFHSTSSVFHGILVKVQQEAMMYNYGSTTKIVSMVTSDDASRITMTNLKDVKSLMIAQHNVIISSGCLMNVIRNDSKSAANFHIAEFNSIFYKRGQMATPSIKQRISKLDVGSGENHFQDYLSALSNASNYFSAGGSYSGSVILAILNLVLHTEQWNRWEFCTVHQFYKPVEMGGFPLVEPFTTSICGSLSNFYLRSSNVVSDENYARMHVRNITSKPELVRLSDFTRTFYEEAMKIDTDLKIFKNAGPMGIVSLLRTDKKLSMFERRCKMSKWNIPDSFTTLLRKASSMRKFLFNVSRTADMTLHDVPEGVNSFYLRYTDPWVSSSRKCHRISMNSSLTHLGFKSGDIISYEELKTTMLSKNFDESLQVVKNMISEFNSNTATVILSRQLTVRFRDSKTILNYVSNQECETFIVPKYSPSTTKLSLKETSESDRVQYTISMVKYLAGEKSKNLINEYTKNSLTYDLMPKDTIDMNIPLKESIILTDNNMHVFEKYVKSYTKMICSGRPSDLTSVVTLILSNRFTESAGVKTVGKVRLAGDYLSTLNYTGWYRDLEARSRQAMNINSRNVLTRTYADVVKFGIISQKETITKFDSFEVTDSLADPKIIMLDTKKKTEFRKTVRNWSVTNNKLMLGNSTVDSLFEQALIPRTEFNVGDNRVCKTVYDRYFNLEVNFKRTIHTITSFKANNETEYHHEFFCQEVSDLIITKFQEKQFCKNEPWVTKFKSEVFYMNEFDKEYKFGNDYYKFTRFHSNVVVTPFIAKNTMTVCISLSKSKNIIPVCHSITSSIDNIDLADPITHSDIVAGVESYFEMSRLTNKFMNIKNNISKFLKELMFKFNYYASTERIDQLSLRAMSRKLNYKQYDILKALLISDINLDVIVSPSKLYNNLNNVCIESESLSSYITSVKIGNTLIRDDSADLDMKVNLADLMEEIEFDKLEDNYEVNFNTIDETDEIDSNESGSIMLDLLDDEEFDVNFDDMEDDDEEEDLLDLLNDLNKTSRQVDDMTTISRSVRTNHTLNPVDEYPSEIIKYTMDWLDSTSVKSTIGLNYDFKNIISVIKYYSTMKFSGQETLSNVLENFYEANEFKLIMPLAQLSAIELS